MLLIYFLTEPILWIVPWILQAIGYYFILKKMGLNRKNCLVPFLAERAMSRKLFRRMRAFYRPFITAVVLMASGYYLGTSEGLGKLFAIIALIVYGVFLIRLYWKLRKSFDKGFLFYIGLLLFPPLFLVILGVGKSHYHEPQLKPIKDHGKIGNGIRRAGLVAVSAVEILVLVVGVGLATVYVLPPWAMVAWQSVSIDEKIKNIKADDEVLSREDMMGESAAYVDTMEPSRDKFFPDHSQDKDVVVLSYFVGSDLETRMGLASANIRQMIKATDKGDDLTFVMEAGGSKRWFTGEIENSSYGRYEISKGKIKKVESLPADTSMSEQKTLEEFLNWAKAEYPADRYMLVLWDHGGGVPYGYGIDSLNGPQDHSGDTMATSQIVEAIGKSGIRFDVVGFDACLMQDIEIASAMEPYADYYLASEETEGGYGWFYTEAFGRLAEDPGTPTEEFGKDIVSTYDQLNTILKDEDGKPDTGATLSLVDTTLAKPAQEKLNGLFKDMEAAVREDSGAYASVAVAGANAYNFSDNIQIDVVDYLNVLSKADYEDTIASDEKIRDVINAVRSCVIYRNKDSAEGINGIAFAFPYKAISIYGDTSDQLKALSMKDEKKAFDTIFSIMAVQQKKAAEDPDYLKDAYHNAIDGDSDPMHEVANSAFLTDYTEEDWYVKGFEKYDTTEALVDIPLKETQEGYSIQVPEKIWKIIADTQTMVYQQSEDKENEMRYMGRDHIGSEDSEGHPLIGMDGNWIHINGKPVCYEAEAVRETKKGDVHSGKVRAKLNGKQDIILNVEWDPVKEGEEPASGHITGYENDSDDIMSSILNSRETTDLEAGDSIQFLFDTYDGEGKLVRSDVRGDKIRITKQSRLKVSDEPLTNDKISIGGVLTDIYQRAMTTELVDLENH